MCFRPVQIYVWVSLGKVFPEELAQGRVGLLGLLCAHPLAAVVLGDQVVEGHDLSLLLHVDHLVAELGQAVEVPLPVRRRLLRVAPPPQAEEHFLEHLADEVEQHCAAVTRLLLLEQVRLLHCQDLRLVDGGAVLEEGGLLHDVALGLHEDSVQHLHEVLHLAHPRLEPRMLPQGEGEVVGEGDEAAAEAGLDEGEGVCVVVVFGDVHVLLGALDDLLGEVVVEAGEEVVGHDEPAPRLDHPPELPHRPLDHRLLALVQFLAAVEGVGQEAQLLAHPLAAGAHCAGDEPQEGLDLAVHGLLVLVLLREDEGVVGAEELHVVQEDLEVEGDVLLEGVEQADVGLLEGLLGDGGESGAALALPHLEQEVELHPAEDEVEHVGAQLLEALLHARPELALRPPLLPPCPPHPSQRPPHPHLDQLVHLDEAPQGTAVQRHCLGVVAEGPQEDLPGVGGDVDLDFLGGEGELGVHLLVDEGELGLELPPQVLVEEGEGGVGDLGEQLLAVLGQGQSLAAPLLALEAGLCEPLLPGVQVDAQDGHLVVSYHQQLLGDAPQGPALALVLVELGLRRLEGRPDGVHLVQGVAVDGGDEGLVLELQEGLVALLVEGDRSVEAAVDVGGSPGVLGLELVVLDVLGEYGGELAEVLELLQVLVDGVQLLDFLALDGEGGVDFEGEVGDLVHGLLEDLELVVDHADVVLHLAHGVDAADELAVVLEHQRLDLVVVHLYLLLDLVAPPHQLLYRVLLQHPQHVTLGVETPRVDVHHNQIKSNIYNTNTTPTPTPTNTTPPPTTPPSHTLCI